MSLSESASKDWPSVVVAVLGAYAVASPFIFENTSIGTTFANLFAGLLLVAYGGYDVYQKQIWGQRLARYWAILALGVWLIGSPFLLISEPVIRNGNIAVGVLVIVFGGYQLFRKTDREMEIDPV
jgi:uncharacterized RDD family membrane protein YckC